MSDESTVLFVATDRLPEGLSSQLERKNVFLEEAKVDHLGPAVVATAPDLVVFVGLEKAEQVFSELGDQPIPVAVIADRSAHKELREVYGTRIAALIPRELPIAALTHRLMTLARRAAKGEKLQPGASLAPGPARSALGARASERKKSETAQKDVAGPIPDGEPRPNAGRPTAVGRTVRKEAPEQSVASMQRDPGRKAASAGSALQAGKAVSPVAVRTRPQAQLGGVSQPSAGEARGRGGERDVNIRIGPGSKGERRGSSLRQVDLASGGEPREASLRAQRGAASPSPQFGGGRQGAAVTDRDKGPEPPTDDYEDLDSMQTAAFELPVEVRRLAKQRSLPPSKRPSSGQASSGQASSGQASSGQGATTRTSTSQGSARRGSSKQGSKGRSVSPPVPSVVSVAPPVPPPAPASLSPASRSPTSRAPALVASVVDAPAAVVPAIGVPTAGEVKTHIAFDRTLMADGPAPMSPFVEPAQAGPGRREAASASFEAPVPPTVGMFRGEGDEFGAEGGDRSSSPERKPFSSDADLPQPTPEQTRRMQEAEALAARIRRSTVAVSAIRVVVCDDDFTRADAITSELREHGLDVMMLSPDYQKARWGVLRRYAPHGLLVDERSLSKGGRQIVGTFRRDPFLKYVPLVAIRFDRLFREDEVRVNLAPLFPLLQPLGREELTLLDRLTISGTLTVDLSQVLPNRLVELLGAYEHTCALECKSMGQRLTWPISGGLAGKAELLDQPGSPGISLKPEDALRWLLAQDEPQVTIASRPQIRLSHPEAIGPLLERVTSSIEPPSEHSIVPPKGARKATGGSYARTLIGVAPAAAPPLTEAAGMPTVPAPAEPGATAPQGRMAVEARLPRDFTALSGNASGLGAAVGRLAAGVRAGLRRVEPMLRPQLTRLRDLLASKKKEWPPQLYWTVVGAAGLVGVLCVVSLFMMCTSGSSEIASDQKLGQAAVSEDAADQRGEGSAVERGAVSAGTQKDRGVGRTGRAAAADQPPDPAVIGKANQAALSRFRVAPDKPTADCKDLVGESTRGTPREAAQYWKAARAKLVQGNSEQAQELMCRSALIEPGGPAAEGLVGFYLGHRSLSQAESWVRRVLAAAPDRRTAQELLSDIQNQQGDPEAALKVLLGTLKLTADDQHKRSLVARKFTTDARASVRSGDLPRAERLLRRAAILDPESAEIGVELAQLYLRLEMPDAASLWARDVLSKSENDPGAHLVLGDIARGAKDYSTARRHYEAIAPGAPGAGRAQGYLQDMPR